MIDALNEIQQQLNIPWAYARFKTQTEPPFIVYLGNGQEVLEADNTYYWKQNTYQLEYYFTIKNEATEATIESILLSAGLLYTKSEDVYIEEEDVFIIYYEI